MNDKLQSDRRRTAAPRPPVKPPRAAKAKERPASKGRVHKGKTRR